MDKFTAAIVEANRQAAQLGLAEAIALSSGQYKTRILAKRPPGPNHPYGLGSSNAYGPRGPIPYGDPAIINEQTGEFKGSWRIIYTATGAWLVNDSEVAEYLKKGTRTMIQRPIEQRIIERTAQKWRDLIEQAIREVIR